MRASRAVALGAALTLAAAMSVLPIQVAGAQSSSVNIVLPSDGSTLTGSQWLDATGPSPVYFEVTTNTVKQCPITGPGGNGTFCPIGYGTLSYYGYLINWNTNSVPNGNYLLFALASASNYSTTQIYVENPGPAVVVPANDSTVSGSQWLDCSTPSGISGFSQAQFWLTGGTLSSPQLLGNATPSNYGWLYDWNTASVPNGNYSVSCSATYPDGGTGSGTSISVTVSN